MSKLYNNRLIEENIKSSNAHCFKDNQKIDGTLILTNIRIYLQINDEEKINEVLLKDIKKVTLGGINVLRIELNNDQRYNFIVNNVISWLKATKKAYQNY